MRGGPVARSEYEDFEDELTVRHYRKVLHEPLAPYVTQTYNTLMHLVQGLVLAAIFYVISIHWGQLTPLIVLNLIICIGGLISLWYSYNTNTQYFIMRATILTTTIPIAMGISQVGLALSVASPIYIFTLFIIPPYILIIIQFWDNIKKHNDPLAWEMWKEHFRELGSKFTRDFFDEIKRYETEGIRRMSYLAILIGILTLFNYYFPLNLTIKGYISFIAIILIFIFMMNNSDMNDHLNRSEKLKKYGYKW
jgi:hypothetical protein